MDFAMISNRFKYLLFLVIIILTFSGNTVLSQEQQVQGEQQKTEDVKSENPAQELKEGNKAENISLDLKGVNIIELFRILSLKTGKTIVSSKNVQGRINIFLNSVSFQDALDIILITQDLASVKRGDIIYIMTQQEYKSRYGKSYGEERDYISVKLDYANPDDVFNIIRELKSEIGKVIVDRQSGTIILIDIPEKIKVMQDAISQLDEPLATRTFELSYADPENVKSQLEAGVISDVGEVIVEERSSKIIVYDLSSRMQTIEKVVKDIDDPDKEVFIEAEIIEITLNEEFKRGISWEKVFDTEAWDGLTFKSEFPVLPALSRYGQMSVGTVDRDNYNAVIQFMERFGDVKILSRPRIAVVNNEEANILVGTKDVYVTQTTSQAESTTVTSESVEFIDVGVKLNVVPTIHADGYVTIEVKPEVSTVSETVTTSLGSRIPIVATSEAETIVKIKDGTMIMIGGLIKRQKTSGKTGIPGLSSIPGIGSLFSTKIYEDETRELVIFLTPHIMKGDKPVEGTEPKYKIPADIMPENLRKRIFLEEIENISTEPKEIDKEEESEKEQEKGPMDIKGIKG